MNVSIVIPAFNEERGVAKVIGELRAVLEERGITAEILVIDDGSTDHTARAAAGARARVFRHRSNRGYGAALKSGISAASNEYVVITDATALTLANTFPRCSSGWRPRTWWWARELERTTISTP